MTTSKQRLALRATFAALAFVLAAPAVHAADAPGAKPAAKSAAKPAAPFEGKVVGGGGTDDMFIQIRRDDGRVVDAYCVDQCSEWFELTGEGEANRVQRKYMNKRVAVIVQTERNNGRIAGPDQDERLQFVKMIRIIK